MPWPEAQARSDAIADAWDQYRAAKAAVYEASGYDAANEEWQARDDDLAALDGAIRDAAAQTFEGLRIKARLARLDIDKGQDPDELLIIGLVREILAMPVDVVQPNDRRRV